MLEKTKNLTRLNQANIFAAVNYIAPTYRLKPYLLETVHQGFVLLADVLDDFASLRDDKGYCQFVSETLGYNLSNGFDVLSKSNLNIKILSNDNLDAGTTYEVIEELGSKNKKINFNTNFSTGLIDNYPQKDKKAILSHEIGHNLIDGSFIIYDEVKAHKSVDYTDDVRDNWKSEFDADQIAMATDLEGSEVAAVLAKSRPWNAPSIFNKIYQKNMISDQSALILSEFCLSRNYKAAQLLKKTPDFFEKKLEFIMNSMLDMKVRKTHPPLISRSVKTREFVQKAKGFLSDQKPK